MAKVYFKVLGCRLNQAEAERMAQGFILAGHEVVNDPAQADICVVNTCTVTRSAAAKSRRAAKRRRPHQKVVVTGCHSEVRPQEFRQADLIVPNAEKENLVALTLERFGLDGYALGMDYRPVGRLHLYPLVLDHTRAFVKIQDGCNFRCTFCLTTIARGPSRSRPAEEIIAEVQALAEQGCQEVVLTGVQAGSYGHDLDTDLGWLLEQILARTDIPRLRLSSLEPWSFKVEWLELWARFGERLCRHFHMSLQSGSNTVLRRMRRVYRAEEYAEKVTTIRAAVPGVAITTDIIVGFPGETEEEHRESLAFVREMAFAGAHIFPFSPRPGTEAATMPNQVPPEVKRRRYEEMKAVTDASAAAFQQAMLGQVLPVLWEQREADGVLSGLTDNYIRVHAPVGAARPNTITPTRLTHVEGERVWGLPVVDEEPCTVSLT